MTEITILIALFIVEIVLLMKRKRELASYNLIVLIFVAAVVTSSSLDFISIWHVIGLMFVAVLNLLGGIIHIKGKRLYDSAIGMVQYDKVIHFLASFFTTLIVYNLLITYLPSGYNGGILWLSFLSAAGLGALYELFEFFGVIFFGHKGVGGYHNNMMDLAFNSIGSIVAIIYILI